MNKGQIESTAIATLKMLINSCETLKDYVVDNDKTPTWDGNIFLFGDKAHTKKDVRKIPVQVKGTTIGKLDSQTITHAVRREELQNYFNDGGVVFFVVLVKGSQPYKVFYKMLLPQDIQPILATFTAKQKEKNITFNEIDSKKLRAIMNHFVANTIKNRKIYTLDEILRQEANQITFSTLVSRKEMDTNPTMSQMIRAICSKDTYQFAVPTGFPDERIPIEKIELMNMSAWRDIYEELTIEGKTFKVTCTERSTAAGKTLYVGANPDPKKRSIVLLENEKEPVLSEINISLQGSLNQQLTDVEFMLALFGHTLDNNQKQRLQAELERLQEQRKLFNEMGLEGDIDLSKFTDADNNILRLIKEGLINEIALADGFCIRVAKFAGYKCMFFVSGTREGYYKIINPFLRPCLLHVACEFSDDGQPINEPEEITVFSIPNESLFYKYSNTDYDAIYTAITSKVTKYLQHFALNMQCNMIAAFDAGQADNDVLELAIKFGNWLKEKTDIDVDCLRLNIIQAQKRMGKVESQDYEYLGDMKTSESIDFRFAAYTLLGEKDSAKKELESMPSDKRAEMEHSPIHTMYKKL